MATHFSATVATVTTVFTFLFAVAAARTSFLPTPADVHLPVAVQSINDHNLHNIHDIHVDSVQESAEGVSNLVILPAETKRSGSNGADPNTADHVVKTVKSEKDRLIRVDLTPRSDFARFHAINRHFFDESRLPLRSVNHRPNRHFRNPFPMPRSEISHGDENEATLIDKTGRFDAEKQKLHRHCSTPSTRLRFKHDNGHQAPQSHQLHQLHHHRQQHHHIHHDKYNKVDVSLPKHKFPREKMKSLTHQHKEKTRQNEVSFMKSIRKFLKHTFE